MLCLKSTGEKQCFVKKQRGILMLVEKIKGKNNALKKSKGITKCVGKQGNKQCCVKKQRE